MNQELKLQAYLDNELPPEEAREVANWLARDREAVALLKSLKATRQALAQFESGIRVPESREFYWSKIRREIETLEAARPEPVRVSWLVQLRRFLIPASAAALLVIAGFVVTRDDSLPRGGSVEELETAVADPKAFTYRDYASGATLVWLSYPADRDGSKAGSSEEIY